MLKLLFEILSHRFICGFKNKPELKSFQAFSYFELTLFIKLNNYKESTPTITQVAHPIAVWITFFPFAFLI